MLLAVRYIIVTVLYVVRLVLFPFYSSDQLFNHYISLYSFINLLKPTCYGMYQQTEHFNNCTPCSHCIYVFCVCLRTNSDLCHLHKKVIGFYNGDEKCLQRGTDWVFI
jgi:hypothetical protein